MGHVKGFRASAEQILLITMAVGYLTALTEVRTAFALTPGIALSSAPAVHAVAVSGQVPDVMWSFFVPQVGPVATPTEGTEAIQFFRACPNNDGVSSLPLSARIKVVARNAQGVPISGIAADDICVLFNGGTAAQGFTGTGADSVIVNSQWNSSPLCPDVRCLTADAPTDSRGSTFITFEGTDPASPGSGRRDPNRKWGHYDSDLPVFVLGLKLSGRLETALPNGTYTLRIKNIDWTGGLGAVNNLGEAVNVTDFNGVALSLGVNSPVSYWKDFDNSGAVDATDLAIITYHMNHNCTFPLP